MDALTGMGRPLTHCAVPAVSLPIILSNITIPLPEQSPAHNNAACVRAQVAQFGLAEVVDTIEPYGSMMAGDWQPEAPARITKAASRAAKEEAAR